VPLLQAAFKCLQLGSASREAITSDRRPGVLYRMYHIPAAPRCSPYPQPLGGHYVSCHKAVHPGRVKQCGCQGGVAGNEVRADGLHAPSSSDSVRVSEDHPQPPFSIWRLHTHLGSLGCSTVTRGSRQRCQGSANRGLHVVGEGKISASMTLPQAPPHGVSSTAMCLTCETSHASGATWLTMLGGNGRLFTGDKPRYL
jgi:hypothetical protein